MSEKGCSTTSTVTAQERSQLTLINSGMNVTKCKLECDKICSHQEMKKNIQGEIYPKFVGLEYRLNKK